MDDFEVIVISNPLVIPQVEGIGRTVEEIILKIKLNGLISPEEQRRFMIEVTFRANDTDYKYTNIFTRENIDSQGEIAVGTIYMRGPVNPEEIPYNATITFITE